jgi:hypothetical protein
MTASSALAPRTFTSVNEAMTSGYAGPATVPGVVVADGTSGLTMLADPSNAVSKELGTGDVVYAMADTRRGIELTAGAHTIPPNPTQDAYEGAGVLSDDLVEALFPYGHEPRIPPAGPATLTGTLDATPGGRVTFELAPSGGREVR